MTVAGPASLSTRQQLARTALSAALAVDGVVAGTQGGERRHVTQAGPELLEGVTVAAQGAGRYSVDLFLVCRPVALPVLAERIRDRVRKSSVLAGLDAHLGTIGVHFEDVEAP